jgi:hypothetical protein
MNITPSSTLGAQLLEISKKSPDFIETQNLKNELKTSLATREHRFLTSVELDSILRWKLDSQYPRSRELRSGNVDSLVIPITKACFEVASDDFEYETDLKVKLLSSIRGIATPIASAVLALTQPDKYSVIDSVLWEKLYGVEKQAFSTREYLRFLGTIDQFRQYTNLSRQETECALWIYCMN